MNFSAKIVVVVTTGIDCTNTIVFITIVLSLRMFPNINTVNIYYNILKEAHFSKPLLVYYYLFFIIFIISFTSSTLKAIKAIKYINAPDIPHIPIIKIEFLVFNAK